jgi:hypothetical protein
MLGHRTKEPGHSTFSIRLVTRIERKLRLANTSGTGSFLDGGANHPYVYLEYTASSAIDTGTTFSLQLAALPFLEPSRVAEEKVHISVPALRIVEPLTHGLLACPAEALQDEA